MARLRGKSKQQKDSTTSLTVDGGILQRQCATCGQHTIAGEVCPECEKQNSLVESSARETAFTSASPMAVLSEFNHDISQIPVSRSSIPSIATQGIHQTTGKSLQTQLSDRAIEKNKTDKFLQAKAVSTNIDSPISVNQDVLKSIPSGLGEQIPPSLKLSLEEGFGAKLDGVRIHDDSATHHFVRDRRAHAVTFGQDIFLGAGNYRNSSNSFLGIIAHEVAHTIQQRNSSLQGQGQDVEQYQNLERQADYAAERLTKGQASNITPGAVAPREQAQAIEENQTRHPLLEVTRSLVLIKGSMTREERDILQTDPRIYNDVVRKLIAKDADWITDKLLEVWVSDDDELAILNRIHKWATTPKMDGGNYLDELLDAIKGYSYRFSYLVTESASGNMLDKLFAEMEDERYTKLTSIIDSFSVRYRGYRGRGGISRWSGLETAVMPSEVRARLGRLNQRLAGRVTLPMTPEEVRKINALYAELRRKTFGLIDMPDLQAGPDVGQQAAPALVIGVPAVVVAAFIKAVIAAIVVTVALTVIIAIVEELERILSRIEQATAEPLPAEPAPVPEEVPVPRPPGEVIPIESHPRYQPRFQKPPQPQPSSPENLGPDIFPPPVPQPEPSPRRRRRRECGPLPISWPRELPRPDRNFTPHLIRLDSAERDWEGLEPRGRAQRNLNNQIRQSRELGLPPPETCFDDLQHQEPNNLFDAHHIHPIYLGGQDFTSNVCALEYGLHVRGHRRLDNQIEWLNDYQQCGERSGYLSRHSTGTEYAIVKDK